MRHFPTASGTRAIFLLPFIATLVSCGDRISPQQMESISTTLSDVMIAVQFGADSTARARIADSVAQAHGFDGWTELREEIGEVAIEPERLRTVFDSAQKRIERRAQ